MQTYKHKNTEVSTTRTYEHTLASRVSTVTPCDVNTDLLLQLALHDPLLLPHVGHLVQVLVYLTADRKYRDSSLSHQN